MARTKRSAKLDTRSARAKLPAEVRHQEPLSPGKYLAYRRPKSGAAGSWLARWYDPETRKDGQERLGTTDDYEDADKRTPEELTEEELNALTILNYGQAQAKALRFFEVRRHQATHGDDALPQDGPLTVAMALDRYFIRCEAQGGKSVKDARQRADLWIKPSLGSIPVAKLTRTKVEAWHQSVASSERKTRPKLRPEPKKRRKANTAGQDEPKPEEPKKPSPEELEEAKRKRKATANRMLSILKAALTCARVQGWVVCSGDAWELVKPFRGVEEPRQQYLTPEEQTRLVNAIDAPDFRRLVSGALYTGCRYGELCRLRVEDFDPTGAGSVLIRLAKAGKSRRVLLTGEGKAFFETITAGRPKRETMFLRDSVERRAHKGRKEDHAWDKNDQQRLMKEACKAAELPVMGFHQLRHSYASALVAAGMPLALVAKLTGHADTRMLERHYAHLAPSDLTRALETFAPELGLPAGNVSDLKIKKQA